MFNVVYTPFLMDDSAAELHEQAILAALSSDWPEALRLNQQIIENYPNNIGALNRLARAYFELGDFKESKKYFENALQNDPYNQIAIKFLSKIETFIKKGVKIENRKTSPLIPVIGKKQNFMTSNFFLEEPGKTKIVTLLKIAEPQRLSLLSASAPINLTIKNHCIAVTNENGEYLGILPDDLSHHLIRLIHGGNKYQAFIKACKPNSLTILIREVFRSARFKNQPSFLEGLNTNLTYSSEYITVPDDSEDEPPFEGDEEESGV